MPNPQCWGLIERGQLRVREAGRSEFLEILASGPKSESPRRKVTVKGGSGSESGEWLLSGSWVQARAPGRSPRGLGPGTQVERQALGQCCAVLSAHRPLPPTPAAPSRMRTTSLCILAQCPALSRSSIVFAA